MKTFISGAKSTEEAPRYDLVPMASIRRQALRMARGAETHGERNFEKGATDPVFVRDRVNHLVGHILAYAADDDSDDHLGAILANAGMLARLEELSAAGNMPERDNVSEKRIQTSVTVPRGNTPDHEQLTYDERRLAAQPCLGGCGKLIQNATTCRPCRLRISA